MGSLSSLLLMLLSVLSYLADFSSQSLLGWVPKRSCGLQVQLVSCNRSRTLDNRTPY